MTFLGARNIESFLRKRKYTGEQVGKAFLLDSVYSYKHKMESGEDVELFTQAQIDRMRATFQTEKDIDTFNGYISLNRWLSMTGLLYNAHYALFDADIKKLVTIYTEAENAQRLYAYIDRLPLILTQKDYYERKEKVIDEELESEDSYYNVFNCLLLALEYYQNLLRKQPRKANPLKKIKKLYSTEQVKTPYILANYNSFNKIGYTTTDENKTDELTAKVLENPLPFEEQIENDDIYALQLAKKMLDAAYEGKPYKVIQPPVFHPEEEVPQFTKWEALNFDLDTYFDLDTITLWVQENIGEQGAAEWNLKHLFFDITEQEIEQLDAASKAGHITEALQKHLYKAFYTEFKEAVDILLQAADAEYHLELASYPADKWDEHIPSKKLFHCDFCEYAKKLNTDSYVFSTNKRAVLNGIAILRPYDLVEKTGRVHTTMDKAGHYKEPLQNLYTITVTGLDQFTDSNTNKDISLKNLDECIENLKKGYYYIQGYAKAIEIIADYIDLPELKVFCPDLVKEQKRVEAIRYSFRLLHQEIKETENTLDPYKKQKLDILEAKLCNIDLGDTTIKPEAIQAVKDDIKDFMGFRASSDIILELLCHKQ